MKCITQNKNDILNLLRLPRTIKELYMIYFVNIWNNFVHDAPQKSKLVRGIHGGTGWPCSTGFNLASSMDSSGM